MAKLFKLVFSIGLLLIAFRKVDVLAIFSEMAKVPWWFVGGMLAYLVLTMVLGAIRWSLLLVSKPGVEDYWVFTKATLLGGFYNLFFPTIVAGDLLKWLPLLKHYPELSKTRLLGSVLIDRVLGFMSLVVIGLTSLVLGKIYHYRFPEILLWLFASLALLILVFCWLIVMIDFEKIFGRFEFLKKIVNIVYLLKKEDKKRMLICFGVSLICVPIWILPVWFYSLIFGVGIGLLQVFIFMPVISLILVLPISFFGFGARENLFLLFFSQLGVSPEKILLISTFGGLMGILNSLLGGLLMVF